ncbi:hypothetical protein [Roseicyclus elongatus]|uniref:hypothetical protein n=1 Tax=Roseicyclus elongatus TaxID=159346 RepID=UPI0012EB5375|nr:hypothetical protein [Roseibacterium elongatum]
MLNPLNRVRGMKDLYYGKLLGGVGDLFEEGIPEDATDPMGFVKRVNRQMLVQAVLNADSQKRDVTPAMKASGELRLSGELVAFGAWMVRDGMPGAKGRPGPAPDTQRLMKVAACAFAALEQADRTSATRSAEAPPITTKDVVKFWNKCFDGAEATSAYTANLRSLRHILEDYLGQVKAGQVLFQGQTVQASPRLKRLAEAIDTAKSGQGARTAPVAATQASAPAARGIAPQAAATPLGTAATQVGSGTPVVAIPETFDIPLVYSSANKEAEYRGGVAPPYTAPVLRYRIEPVQPSRPGSQVRADLAGRVVFRPTHRIAGTVSIKALIDRIALIVKTRNCTSDQALRSAITLAGANVHVEDRTKIGAATDHHASLPTLPISEPTGWNFAVTVFDPRPKMLRTILDTIESCSGIDGEVQLFQLELSVDLYPHKKLTPQDALQIREQLVGLMQRHVWSAPTAFDVSDGSAPRTIDQRQVYEEAGNQRTRYVFADAKRGWDSDRAIKEPDVRLSLLNAKPGNDLYLDATIYRGHMNGRKRTNSQHKIGDRRNKTKGTFLNLPGGQRRARIEVTLTSLEALEEAGLRRVGDLKGYKFRSLIRDLLVFRLPTSDLDADEVNRTIAQMRTRGVYGVEFSQRAKYLEERERTKPRPRNTDHEGRGLVDWPEMNEQVGRALDQLHRQWREF